jgi:hypothetical protein
MAHAYTPGLRVTERAVVRRERRLPLKGTVLVARGDRVDAATVVARSELPGNVQTVNVAARLSIDPPRVPDALVRPIGATVAAGEVVATGRSLFGLLTHKAVAPVDGVIESVSAVTGQLILREAPIPVEVNAYVRGRVVEVLAEEGVVVESEAAFVQGIFGVGGETHGTVALAVGAPDAELSADRIDGSCRGRVLIGGAYVSYETLMRARDAGAAAVVVAGFDDRDLRRLLGKDLGVAITGSEDLGITLVLTEGFGRIPMADRTWKLLAGHQGDAASVSGATQIRAGVMRPEILVPLVSTGAVQAATDAQSGVEIGSLLRVIRQPWFGRIGTVVELPAELRELESGSLARVMVVEFTDDGSRAVVPRANVERIES